MASSDENNVAFDCLWEEIGSSDDLSLPSDGESVSSQPINSVGKSDTILNLQTAMKLVRINSELSVLNAQKDILIANLEHQKREKDSQIVELKEEKKRQFDDFKEEKSDLKHDIWKLEKKSEKLQNQLNEMRDRHMGEINKFHERMYENMSARCEAEAIEKQLDKANDKLEMKQKQLIQLEAQLLEAKTKMEKMEPIEEEPFDDENWATESQQDIAVPRHPTGDGWATASHWHESQPFDEPDRQVPHVDGWTAAHWHEVNAHDAAASTAINTYADEDDCDGWLPSDHCGGW